MTEKKSRKKSAVTGLTPTQEVVVEAILDGKTNTEAAQIAGCTPTNVGNMVKTNADVQTSIAQGRSELANLVQINRADVIAGFMEAIDTARLAADPGSMIRGWTEIGKMLGLYAPEVKKVELTANQRAIQSKFDIMSDAELLALAEEHNVIIEGECTTVQ